MNLSRLFFILLLLAAWPPAGPAQKRNEIVELQREMALTQDQVRKMQTAMEEKLGALTALVQQALDTANKSHSAMAALDGSLRDRLRQQEKSLVEPVAAIGTKVEETGNEARAVREAVGELAALVRKQQLQLVDLANAVRTLQAPPAPPPSAGDGSAAVSAPPAGVSAQSLYDNALRDKTSGNADLALQQFQDYLRYFPKTDHAPNAQFHIGEIHYGRSELDPALKAFETVLERYPENNKSADALYMKAMTLAKMGEKAAAAEEFRSLLRDYPNADVAVKARRELKVLGYPPPAGGTRRKK